MTDESTDAEIDVRPIARGRRHPLVFAAYRQLETGQSLVLINDHEPRHLREEFERELAGGFGWEPVPGSSDEAGWRIRITKHARTALPRVVGDAHADAADVRGGSLWQLDPVARDLDANIIALPAGDEIRRHDGPELDVLLLVLEGAGTLETEDGELALTPGMLVWLPRRSQRRFVAGRDGLRYFSVHQRKPALTITARSDAGPQR